MNACAFANPRVSVRRVKTTLVILGVLSAPIVGHASEFWPLFHEVLEHQRERPCRETWTHGKTTTTYAMTLDRAGRLVRRDEDDGSAWRYRHDRRGRIVAIEGEVPGLMQKTVTNVAYGPRGISSVRQLTSTQNEMIRLDGHKPTFRTSKFDLTWKYDGPDVVRISAIVNGKSEGTDVQHYERGRLVSTDLDVGDVMTAAYDADGRLASMTMSYQGKPSEVTRYTYDDKGRLAREERDRDHDGVVDQTRDYAYSCTTK